jgi:hypothetical protein
MIAGDVNGGELPRPLPVLHLLFYPLMFAEPLFSSTMLSRRLYVLSS